MRSVPSSCAASHQRPTAVATSHCCCCCTNANALFFYVQASKDKVSYDAFWFMSNTSMVNNTVFHSLVIFT